MAEYFIGLMSGTSVDALDTVLIELTGEHPQLISTLSRALPESLRTQLIDLTLPGDNEIERAAQADIVLGQFSAETVLQLLQQAGVIATDIRAVGSHGQTIRHGPDSVPPYTVQIGDPNTIAQLTGITTVADFRRRDMVVGGQGAPLVPAFHNALYRNDSQDRVALNLGGIANITILPADLSSEVTGFDTGPANGLMDAWCQRHLQRPYDQGGCLAANGSVNQRLLEQLEDDPYFELAPPKSTGREHFNLNWLLSRLPADGLSDEDTLATLAELTVRTVANAITKHAPNTTEVIVCGGGAYNTYLMQRLQANLPGVSINSSAAYGVEPRWIEAMAFAWLARQTLNHLPGNLPAVTGAHESVILGAIYPASPRS